jgi:integrating conjugative element protein (TIGR03761 family)
MNPMQPAQTSFDATGSRKTDHPLVPGKLRGEAVLTLQTQQAARLVRGRPQTADKPAILGLLSFAALCRTIWHGSRADDPYADWWQRRVDSALAQSRLEIDTAEAQLDGVLATDDGFTVEPARSEKPMRIALNFTNPDAFRAAQLIGRYDRLACRALTLGHTGGLARQDAMRLVNTGGRAVRRALQSAVGYRMLGIDRDAVRQQTARAAYARQLMGECPNSLLDRPVSPAQQLDQPAEAVAPTPEPVVPEATLNDREEAGPDMPADAAEAAATTQESESHDVR